MKTTDMQLLAGQRETLSMTELRSRPGDVVTQVQMGKTFDVEKNSQRVATVAPPEATALELGAAIRRLGLATSKLYD